VLFKRNTSLSSQPVSDPLEQTAAAYRSEEERQIALAKTNLSAFAPIYEHYFPRIYRYCLRRTGQAQQAEDLTSLVFTRAMAGLNGYTQGSFAAWLFRIAHNAVANYRRSLRPQVSLEAVSDTEQDWLAEDSAENTLESLAAWEERAQIGRLIAALSEEQQELLALSVAGGMSAKEVGQVLGKSEGAVRMALHRTIGQLKTAYRQQYAQEQEDTRL
jgi:RNA polymerase sigma-70 factor (ECF subfamily)